MYEYLYILEIWNVKLYDYPESILILYRLVTFKNQLHTHPSHIHCYSFVCCHIYAFPAFSGQLSSGDKDRLDGLFRKAFERRLCSDVFYRAMHFSAKRGIAIACRLSVRLSVRPSVRPSVCDVGKL